MDIGWKIASAGSLAVAGFIADKIVDLGWKAVTGHTAPRNAEEEAQANLAEVVIFGVVSGVLVTLIRRLTVKQTNKWYGGRTKDAVAEHSER
ncbi:DUF4235 domain-containing protein [Nanchangia anserum]|uniref:DUF4235 domain-containing protein n=1 Tax=Nanchangia anserum TaxID=2692125 RepID=A0A8I0GFV6_9ACTO|nr:DUF4235 domain-containing protein [Nanchangia anserum]MBD3689269.1 DUF4235 domain-containing protein [Nanchangia anserum]QOX81489.1 DUF4235 domain-containing protein [Nanchangia anserum]